MTVTVTGGRAGACSPRPMLPGVEVVFTGPLVLFRLWRLSAGGGRLVRDASVPCGAGRARRGGVGTLPRLGVDVFTTRGDDALHIRYGFLYRLRKDSRRFASSGAHKRQEVAGGGRAILSGGAVCRRLKGEGPCIGLRGAPRFFSRAVTKRLQNS